jgi:hypothetical protein
MLPGDLDLSGWDVRKALALFARSNPPLLEWLDSPITYRDDGQFAAALRHLLPTTYSPVACLHHYLSMARKNRAAYLGRPRVRWKKYLYVVRPLLAARWVAAGRGPAPTPFATLLDTLTPDEAPLRTAIDALLAKKATAGEAADGPPVPELEAFADAEPDRLAAHAAGLPTAAVDWDALNQLFRRTVGR